MTYWPGCHNCGSLNEPKITLDNGNYGCMSCYSRQEHKKELAVKKKSSIKYMIENNYL